MQGVPIEVEEYLSAGDGLGQVSVEEAHPNVKQTLNAPETRRALLRYLAGDAPWETASSGLVIGTLTFVLAAAVPPEAPSVRPLLLHPVPEVRTRAYLFLVAAGRQDRAEVVALLQSMLLDPDDMVRTTGVREIERTGTVAELRTLLERWMKLAHVRGWDEQESHELLGALLRQK